MAAWDKLLSILGLADRVAHVDSNSADDFNMMKDAFKELCGDGSTPPSRNMKEVNDAFDDVFLNGTLDEINGKVFGIITKAGSYTILDADLDGTFIFSGASANGTFTLPTLAANLGRKIRLINNDTTYGLTVAGEGSETIDGCTTIQMPKRYNYIEVLAAAGGWIIVNEAITCQLRLNTYAGYGSTDNKIMRFTNLSEYIGNCFTHNHTSGYAGNTKGLEITIAKPGKYSFSFTLHPTGASNFLGLSLNSAALTTSIEGQAVNVKLCIAHVLTNIPNSATIELYLNSGDVIRPHSTGGAVTTYVANCLFSATYLGK